MLGKGVETRTRAFSRPGADISLSGRINRLKRALRPFPAFLGSRLRGALRRERGLGRLVFPFERFNPRLRIGQACHVAGHFLGGDLGCLLAGQLGGVPFLGDVVGGAYQVRFDLSEAAGQFGFFSQE